MYINTSKVKEFTKKKLQQVRLRKLACKDVKRFSKAASFSVFDSSYDQLESRIMYNVHALEKGLSRRKNQRLGFGKKALQNLNDALVVYVEKGYSKAKFPFMQGCSVLQKYKAYHEAQEYDVGYMRNLVNDAFLEEDMSKVQSGFKIIRSVDKRNNSRKTFYEICEQRASVRDFEGTPVNIDDVMKVIDIAKKTPSVCNRQGWHVYLVRNREIIKRLLVIQRGFSGYTLPEYVLVITVSNSAFLSPVERNEVFVDGGLFSMSVLYGLEQAGLAAVPLNAMMNSKQELAMRNLLSIDNARSFVMFIAVGNFPEQTISPVSARKSASEFTVII